MNSLQAELGTARPPLPLAAPGAPSKMADAIADWLADAGFRFAFGVSGGGIANLWSAVGAHASLRLVHCQHEAGAAFAAAEASLAADVPSALLTTTGPGLTNALTGVSAAKSEGAKVVVFSSLTPASRRGRIATQETHAAMPIAGLFEAGPLFDLAAVVESPSMLPSILHKVVEGLARPSGFVANIGLPTDVQSAIAPSPIRIRKVHEAGLAPRADVLDRIADGLLSSRPWILVGFEARRATNAILELAERTGALVCATPRAKGVFPENHPQYVGVLGFAGHDAVERLLARTSPAEVLVLGSRLGEGASSWSAALGRCRRLIQVHPSPELLAGPFPEPELLLVRAPVGAVVDELLRRLPAKKSEKRHPSCSIDERSPSASTEAAPIDSVRPTALIDAIQSVVVDGSEALLMADSGNSFAWAIHRLRLPSPRLRVSVTWGSMAHFSTGCIGAALATGGKIVTLTGDGSMLMGHEISTAVRLGLPIVWIVSNDGGYTMCKQGMAAQGLRGKDLSLPPTDFALFAKSLGALALRVRDESKIVAALQWALAAQGPVVLDVLVDPNEIAPIGRRIQALTWHENPAAQAAMGEP